MHFALPPRKSSSPPPYARASARNAANRKRQTIQGLSYAVLFTLTVYLVFKWVFKATANGDDRPIPEDSSILIVTVLDEGSMSEDYIEMIKANREDYASRHGYKTFYTNASTFKDIYTPAPSSWALIPALRQALTLHPETDYLWSLSPHALITNITLSLHKHVFGPLPTLMRKDIPVVPPDSVIHTFSHLTPSSANLIIAQDVDNLIHSSFILRNTLTIPKPSSQPRDDWTQYFLDAWLDPLYRAYAFQKAENHALEHIVQWHPTLLAKLVVVDQRRLSSYNFQYAKGPPDPKTGVAQVQDSMWQEGDLIVNLKGCDESDQRDCEKEMRGYFGRWEKLVEKLDGKPSKVKLKTLNEQYTTHPKEKSTEMADWEKKRIHM